MKTRMIIGGLASGVAAFVPFLIAPAHACTLCAPAVEYAMLVTAPVLASYWTARAKNGMWVLIRAVCSFFAAIVIIFAYLTWLHSPLFPTSLLHHRARARRETAGHIRDERGVEQHATETNARSHWVER